MFATSKGFEMPRGPAGAACTHVHDFDVVHDIYRFDVVHGVTAMGSGVGYSLVLFLCDTRGDTSDVLNKVCLEEFHHLVAPTLAQLPYLEASVEVLRGTSDDLRLAAAVDGDAVDGDAGFLAAHVRCVATAQGWPASISSMSC